MTANSDIRFPCPACRRPLTADGQRVGRPTRCPGCAAKLVVPPPADGPATQFVELTPILPFD